MPGELKVTDHVVGTGAEAVKGKTVHVHYAGRLEDGTEFDNSFKRGEPIRFRLGVGQVIEGWDKGILGLKVGGKRTLVIPRSWATARTGPVTTSRPMPR